MRIPLSLTVVVNGILLATLFAAGLPGFARDKYETIDAQAWGTSTQLGASIGVTLNVYEFSTPADRQILIQAYEKAQNQGLVTALQKMKAVGHVEITGTLGNDCSYIAMTRLPRAARSSLSPIARFAWRRPGQIAIRCPSI